MEMRRRTSFFLPTSLFVSKRKRSSLSTSYRMDSLWSQLLPDDPVMHSSNASSFFGPSSLEWWGLPAQLTLAASLSPVRRLSRSFTHNPIPGTEVYQLQMLRVGPVSLLQTFSRWEWQIPSQCPVFRCKGLIVGRNWSELKESMLWTRRPSSENLPQSF